MCQVNKPSEERDVTDHKKFLENVKNYITEIATEISEISTKDETTIVIE